MSDRPQLDKCQITMFLGGLAAKADVSAFQCAHCVIFNNRFVDWSIDGRMGWKSSARVRRRESAWVRRGESRSVRRRDAGAERWSDNWCHTWRDAGAVARRDDRTSARRGNGRMAWRENRFKGRGRRTNFRRRGSGRVVSISSLDKEWWGRGRPSLHGRRGRDRRARIGLMAQLGSRIVRRLELQEGSGNERGVVGEKKSEKSQAERRHDCKLLPVSEVG